MSDGPDQAEAMINSSWDMNAPGKWLDSDGHHIHAHGAGILEHGGKVYWYGEIQKWGKGFNVYRSDSGFDGPWQNCGRVLTQEQLTSQAQDRGVTYEIGVMERPKVLYNQATEKFVMWFHMDDPHYLQRHVGIAVSESPEGPFVLENHLEEHKGMNTPSLDLSIWMDPVTQKAFFIRDQRIWTTKNADGFGSDETNHQTSISLLSDDYLSIHPDGHEIGKPFPLFEGMAIFYETPQWPEFKDTPNAGGRYWIIGSPCDGWNPHDLTVWYTGWDSQGLDDPNNTWTQSESITGSPTGHNSQPAYISRTADKDGNQYFIYHGDNWMMGAPHGDNCNVCQAGYVWLPFNVSSGKLQLGWRDSWSAATIKASDL